MLFDKQDNRFLSLIRSALVAEIERDFPAFDEALSTLKDQVDTPLLLNLSSIALFANNPVLARDLSKRAMAINPGSEKVLNFVVQALWFSGDVKAVADLRNRIENLGGEMESITDDAEVSAILAEANISVEHYTQYVDNIHGVIRQHLAHQRNVRLELLIDTAEHEDGSKNIVFEVMTDEDEERLDKLDDMMLEMSIDDDKMNPDLRRVMTCLVRDIRQFPATHDPIEAF